MNPLVSISCINSHKMPKIFARLILPLVSPLSAWLPRLPFPSYFLDEEEPLYISVELWQCLEPGFLLEHMAFPASQPNPDITHLQEGL